MPVLDAKALKTDRKGLAFLRSVLRRDGETGTKEGEKTGERSKPQTGSKCRDG